MAGEPKKIFDLMDTETEPTDEQLTILMGYVGDAVRARKDGHSSGWNYSWNEDRNIDDSRQD